MKPIIKLYFLINLILIITSCVKKENKLKEQKFIPSESLFIEIPRNTLVFDNLSPILYECLWNHFKRAGYKLQTNSSDAYRLSTKIKDLQEADRLVSPDILTYGFRAILKLECTLTDNNGKTIESKDFTFKLWTFKSENPALHQFYLNTQYQEMLDRAAIKIDHYFRKFFIKK